jgi:hypothetical protein
MYSIDQILAAPPFGGDRFAFVAALHDACVVKSMFVPEFLALVHNNPVNVKKATSRVGHLVRALRGDNIDRIEGTLGIWIDFGGRFGGRFQKNLSLLTCSL